MAVQSICAKLMNGQDASCEAPVRKFYQQAVVIDKNDIDPTSIVINTPDPQSPTAVYNVSFSLKPETTGYRFIGPQAGNNYRGYESKSRTDNGHVQYVHNAQVLVVGLDEETQALLDALDKSLFVVAYQLMNGTVVIYGLESGMATGDYDYNLAESGGAVPIMLTSLEDSPEPRRGLIYVSETPGSETADFDDAFSNITPAP